MLLKLHHVEHLYKSMDDTSPEVWINLDLVTELYPKVHEDVPYTLVRFCGDYCSVKETVEEIRKLHMDESARLRRLCSYQ
jgi:hypothetical protein